MNSALFGINIVLLVVSIIMAIAAIRAVNIARHSLKETQKTRRDNFLPIVIPRGIGWEGQHVRNNGNIRIENIGRGPAWNIAIDYPSGESRHLAKFLHHEKGSMCDAVLPWPDFAKVPDELLLTLRYNDTFNRLLKVSFRVTKEKGPQEIPVLKYNQKDGFEFMLPD
jgi:hypothetical protein